MLRTSSTSSSRCTCARTSRRTPTGDARRSTDARRVTPATVEASASASASRRRSAGSRPWLDSAGPSSAAAIGSGGPSPLRRRRTTWCGCPSSWLERCREAPARHAKAFKGRWRISEMDVWDNDYLDLVEPAHIVFESENDGAFVFGTVKGWLDVRYGARDGSACAEFSWEGLNDTDPACGRGWVILGTAGRLVGHIFIHNSDDSGFVAERE